jgi:hypothetical protein
MLFKCVGLFGDVEALACCPNGCSDGGAGRHDYCTNSECGKVTVFNHAYCLLQPHPLLSISVVPLHSVAILHFIAVQLYERIFTWTPPSAPHHPPPPSLPPSPYQNRELVSIDIVSRVPLLYLCVAPPHHRVICKKKVAGSEPLSFIFYSSNMTSKSILHCAAFPLLLGQTEFFLAGAHPK